MNAIQCKLTRLAVMMWPAVPKRVKVALYLKHRAKITTRASIFIN